MGIFRKPMPQGMKVSDCLREFETGGIRRRKNGLPFEDVIRSERTPKAEREIANHPSISLSLFCVKSSTSPSPWKRRRR